MAMPETVERAFLQDAGMSRALLAMLGTAIRDKSLVWVALLGALGLWIFAACKPELLRLGAAGAYSALVYWPILLGRKGGT